MTKEQFLQQFHLSPCLQKNTTFLSDQKLTAAAVLIPICYHNNELTIILTKRAKHLRHHAGQVSFPGGKAEKNDKDLIATAIRETKEEIGLTIDKKDIIGKLSRFHTLTGYEITPVVAFINKVDKYQLDTNEVSHVFHLPFHIILEPNNIAKVDTYIQNKKHHIYFIQHNEHNIWGATAAILHELACLIRI